MIKQSPTNILRSIAPAIALALSLAACSTSTVPTPAATSGTSPAPTGATPTTTDAETEPVAGLGALGEIQAFIKEKAIDTSADNWRLSLPRPPQLSFEPGSQVFWDLVTSEGNVTVKLLTDVAPMHVSSTIYLTELGFYNDLTFHRIIPGFMAQGGCPLGKGTGSPGYSYGGEFSPSVRHDRPGLLSMANRGPGTDGSQFFLTFVPTHNLNDKHTIFGEVTEGMDAVSALEQTGSRSGKTSKPVNLISATIRFE